MKLGQSAIALLVLFAGVSAYDTVQFFGHDAMVTDGVMAQTTMSFTSMPTSEYIVATDSTEIFSTFVIPANSTVSFPLEFEVGDAVFFNFHVANLDAKGVFTMTYDTDVLGSLELPAGTASSYELPLSLENATSMSYFNFTTSGRFSGYVYLSTVAKVYTPRVPGDDGVIVFDLFRDEYITSHIDPDFGREAPPFTNAMGLDSFVAASRTQYIGFNIARINEWTMYMNSPVLLFEWYGQTQTADYSAFYTIHDEALRGTDNNDDYVGAFFDFSDGEPSAGNTKSGQIHGQFPLINMTANFTFSLVFDGQFGFSRFVRIVDGYSNNTAMLTEVYTDEGYQSSLIGGTDDITLSDLSADDGPCVPVMITVEFYAYTNYFRPPLVPAFCSSDENSTIIMEIPKGVYDFNTPWVEFDLWMANFETTLDIQLALVDESVVNGSALSMYNSMYLDTVTVQVDSADYAFRQTLRVPLNYDLSGFAGLMVTRADHGGDKFHFIVGTIAQFYDAYKASATPSPSITASQSASQSNTQSNTQSASQSASQSATTSQTASQSMTASVSQTTSQSVTTSQSATVSGTAMSTPSVTASASMADEDSDHDHDDDDDDGEAVVNTKVQFVVTGSPNDILTAVTSEGSNAAIKEVLSHELNVPASHITILSANIVSKKQVTVELELAIRETADVSAETIAEQVTAVDTEELAAELNTAFAEQGVDLEVSDVQVSDTTVNQTSVGFMMASLMSVMAALMASVALN